MTTTGHRKGTFAQAVTVVASSAFAARNEPHYQGRLYAEHRPLTKKKPLYGHFHFRRYVFLTKQLSSGQYLEGIPKSLEASNLIDDIAVARP